MLGVLGGMGPMATVDFMKKIIESTPANCDQDHIPMIVYSGSEIPDRTEAILGAGQDPFPFMVKAVNYLESGGASLIVMPCNTAHYWYDRLRMTTSTPILHIADAVSHDLQTTGFFRGTVGLLATSGTLKARIYQDRLAMLGYSCVLPVQQDAVMHGIKLVKSGNLSGAREILINQVHYLLKNGCDRIILGCTEIPVALSNYSPKMDEDLKMRLIDSNTALAKVCITRCAPHAYTSVN